MSFSAGARGATRIYYDDPAMLEFAAEVTAIREVARVEGRQVWQIALDRTAFYPTGGGQPFDTGVLVATARSGASLEVSITAVEEDSEGEVWHTTAKPLQEGTQVRGLVDADRRHDHSQQHSGQHLLSAVLRRDLQAATVSFHLGAQNSTIDVACENISDETLAQVERAANTVIRQALPVSVRYVSQHEAEEMLRTGQLAKLPPRTGRMRLVEIPDLDLNACGGTHVSNTAEIGPLLLQGTERVRENIRLAFVCGDRALEAAHNHFYLLQRLGASLSTGKGEVAEAVARLQAESRAAAKERGLLLQALAEGEAGRLASESEASGATTVIHTVDTQQPGRDAFYAKLLASRLVTATTATLALVMAPERDRCSVILAAKPGTLDCGSILRAALADCNGRGGGSREMAQGSLPQAHAVEFLESINTKFVAEAQT